MVVELKSPLPDEVREIVERLRIRTGSWMVAEQLCIEAAEMIERLARQVPEGCVVVPTEYPLQFSAWLKKEMPAGTVIGDPVWWAKRLYKAMIAAGEVKP